MRIQFPSNPTLDSAKQDTNRGMDRAPWQAAGGGRTVNPAAQRSSGKRMSNAPRRRAY